MTVAALNVNHPMPQGNVKSMTQSSTASDMIRVSNLTRRYGDFVALASVYLAVKE